MAIDTGIEYARSTFNPWVGCTHVSPGCDYCYAMGSLPARQFKVVWGAAMPRHRTSEANWNQVRRWNRQAASSGEFWPVFTGSLCDIFDNEVASQWRNDLWRLVRDCPDLTFIIITKRIGNAPRMLPPDWGDGYPNVWLLSTITSQAEADRDIPKLLLTRAVVHGLSMEPLLGAVDISRWLRPFGPLPALDWVIAGGENHRFARPLHPEWAMSIQRQCAEAGTAFFFKQWGHWIAEGQAPEAAVKLDLHSRRWVSLEGYDHYTPSAAAVYPVGKKAAGSLLNQKHWRQYPNGLALASSGASHE